MELLKLSMNKVIGFTHPRLPWLHLIDRLLTSSLNLKDFFSVKNIKLRQYVFTFSICFMVQHMLTTPKTTRIYQKTKQIQSQKKRSHLRFNEN